ncbi:MAG: TATA-box-binding protein [Methanomassiliicoccales archaeon]|nr:TATA-box-binding protein [Methanomassiliicoccales archaeon]
MNAIETRPRVENIVASTQFAKELDLCTVAEKLTGSEYDPDRFPGLIYRLSDPKTAILLFRSGKANCTGGKSLEEVRRAIRRFAIILNKLGIPVDSDPEIIVQNMVAVYDIGCALNLANLAMSLGLKDIEYEPEQFPGLVYRLRDPNVVCLLFGSGKMVITGAKNDRDIGWTVDKVVQVLRQTGFL